MNSDVTTIYYELEDGRVLEWLNWNDKARGKRIFGRYLDSDDVKQLRAMRELEYTDREIFVHFHPDIIRERKPTPVPSEEEVAIPLTMLSKEQLLFVIEKKLGEELPSLAEASEEDLITLFRKINSLP